MFVLTVDQRRSRRGTDLVPELLSAHERIARPGDGVVLPLERTVGDEAQALLDDAALVVDTVLQVVRDGRWSVGIGVGGVDTPLPGSTRAARGPAYLAARDAVERAKRRPGAARIAVELGLDAGSGGGDGPPAWERAARDAEALLVLLGAVVARRTDAGWEVVDRLARAGATQGDLARDLGVSQQAVSQRLLASMWPEEAAARPLAARLLQEADRS
ncbi:hypothetical protein [Luteimicrobium subarcticum]|uniref:SatD family protein n=1 Tax=Luteimicrobium subarcticum TaxID=620910 RepID=A0A2M8W3X0_9MICO|nr:hypothetical protein [Luteimicrobium subarcticum]PJI85615.1 hypothetical protein CLV34_2798 [Luteimicrobium subarcticum]